MSIFPLDSQGWLLANTCSFKRGGWLQWEFPSPRGFLVGPGSTLQFPRRETGVSGMLRN